MAKIENQQYTIQEAFQTCFYVVPDYQREYVWTEKEVQQLLDDIDEQVDVDRASDYFVGMVLVSPRDQKNHVDVIDGQQRLTTFFLLLCALRRLLGDAEQADLLKALIQTTYTSSSGKVISNLRLEPRYENAADFMGILARTNGRPQDLRSAVKAASISIYGSVDRLLDAYAVITRHLEDNYDEREELERYWGYVANHVVFIQISTDISSALKIFETINERGVGLNPMDLLKNLLFTHVRPDQFRDLKDDWKEITAPLEKKREKPLRFLRYFLMANYHVESARKDAVIREDEIYDWLTKDENAAQCGYRKDPFGFVGKIARAAAQYLNFIDGRGNDGAPNTDLENLKQLTGEGFSLHYVLLMAAAELPKPLFDHFVRQLESFLFFYIFTKTPTKDLERSFSSWADELRQIVRMTGPEQIRRLNEFLEQRFATSMTSKSGELEDALKRYGLQTMQRYRTRYLLAKLTQFVDMAYQGQKAIGPLKSYAVLEVEHILPDNPSDALRKRFEKDNPGAAYEEWKNRLGNLTLLEKPINIVAGNDFFEKKKPHYRKAKAYLTSSLIELAEVGKNSSITRINQKLVAFDRWSTHSIEMRQAMLAGLARDVWRVIPVPNK